MGIYPTQPVAGQGKPRAIVMVTLMKTERNTPKPQHYITAQRKHAQTVRTQTSHLSH